MEARTRRKAYLHIVLPRFITSIIAHLDRNNLSYAVLTMNQDLGFTAEMFGFGAGIFFAGYVLFEIPGSRIADRFSPKWRLARIMISWGLLTGLMAFILVRWMADSPSDAKWLAPDEKQFLIEQLEKEVAAKNATKRYSVWQALREKEVLKLRGTCFLWMTGYGGAIIGCRRSSKRPRNGRTSPSVG